MRYKVVTSSEMRRIEQLAEKSGLSENESVERAGFLISDEIIKMFGEDLLDKTIYLLIGKGNKGADAYVAGEHLLKAGVKVIAYRAFPPNEGSKINLAKHAQFISNGGKVKIPKKDEDADFSEDGIIIDGLLGTGFEGEEILGTIANLIESANLAGNMVISIDIPSGVDGNTGFVADNALMADATFCMGLPKIGCFLGKAWEYSGKISIIDFGLPDQCIEEAKETAFLCKEDGLKTLIPFRDRCINKYESGYVIGIGGEMSGASLLSSLAALRTGAGLVRLFVPQEYLIGFQNKPYEVILEDFAISNMKRVLAEIRRSKAVFLGPGLGRSDKMQKLVNKILIEDLPALVLDADALHAISEVKKVKFPPRTVLTPHRGEMLKLLKTDGVDILKETEDYCNEHNVNIILKGSPTFIFFPSQKPLIIYQGDPGMATAGSGDVLTGMVAASIAMGDNFEDSIILAASLHGIAGEFSAIYNGSFSMIASDIIENIDSAYRAIIEF